MKYQSVQNSTLAWHKFSLGISGLNRSVSFVEKCIICGTLSPQTVKYATIDLSEVLLLLEGGECRWIFFAALFSLS